MRKSLILIATLLVVTIPAAAYAQYGVIGLYTDASAGNCEVYDSAQGIFDVWVVHTMGTGASAAQFKVQPSAGFTATYLGDFSPFEVYLGNSQTGISIAYGECLSGTIVLLRITYLFDGSSATCGKLEITGDPAEIQYPNDPIIADCGSRSTIAKHVVQGGVLFVNPDGSCPCFLAVPVQESTWGQIKSLYGE